MRILVIEDSLRLQRSLESGLRRAGYAVDVVGDGERGATFAKRGVYDAVVLDIMLPGKSGLEVLTEMRASGIQTHVLLLTARHSVEDRILGLRAGADDYLPKPFAFGELVARLEALLRRSYGEKQSRLEHGALALDTSARKAWVDGVEVVLTKREFRVLSYLLLRRGSVVTRIELEDHIYGEHNLPSSNAVESTISIMRKKFREVDSRHGGLIETRHGVGYSLVDGNAAEGELASGT